jgi:hypothetical protein
MGPDMSSTSERLMALELAGISYVAIGRREYAVCDGAFIFTPHTGHWRAADDSSYGYRIEGLLEACQYFGGLPEPDLLQEAFAKLVAKNEAEKHLGFPEAEIPAAGRDSATPQDSDSDKSTPESAAISTDASEMTGSAESAAGSTMDRAMPRTPWP